MNTDNFDLIEKNEFNKNANGGTELMQRRLYSSLPRELLEKFQITASRPSDLKDGMKHILWAHDLAEDPAVRFLADPAEHSKYDKFVFVSNQQMHQFNQVIGIPFNRAVVIENGITPIDFNEVEKKLKDFKEGDTINIVYTPTPHRGLAILLPVFEELAKKYSNIHLHVFSSFKLYGWAERDAEYTALFNRCKDHKQITYHGTVTNKELMHFLATEAHVFAYPSIWQETSCLCLIEAMSAGLVAVHPNYAALPETSGGLTAMYQWDEDLQEHARAFSTVLETVIESYSSEFFPYIARNKTYADSKYNWDMLKYKWEALLTTLSAT